MSQNLTIRFLAGPALLIAAAFALVSPAPPPRPGPPLGPAAPRSEQTAVDDRTRQRIDEWIARNGLNPYGDPPDSMYNGGTPLFNERTGVVQDRYLYILERHPELKDDGPRKR